MIAWSFCSDHLYTDDHYIYPTQRCDAMPKFASLPTPRGPKPLPRFFHCSKYPITSPAAPISHTHSTLWLGAPFVPFGTLVDIEPDGTVVVPVAIIVAVSEPMMNDAGSPEVGVMSDRVVLVEVTVAMVVALVAEAGEPRVVGVELEGALLAAPAGRVLLLV